MKNLLKYILSLVILFGVVPVNGQQEVIVTVAPANFGDTQTTQTLRVQEVKECCQVASSEEVKKKKKKKGKKIQKGTKKKKKGFFSKVFGSK